jgi:hypothetical protein
MLRVFIPNNQGKKNLHNGDFFKAAKSFHSDLDTINHAAMEVDHAGNDDDDDEAMHTVDSNTVTFEMVRGPRCPQHEDKIPRNLLSTDEPSH